MYVDWSREGDVMDLFAKTGITLLQDLLEQVKGGVYILATKYEKKDWI